MPEARSTSSMWQAIAVSCSGKEHSATYIFFLKRRILSSVMLFWCTLRAKKKDFKSAAWKPHAHALTIKTKSLNKQKAKPANCAMLKACGSKAKSGNCRQWLLQSWTLEEVRAWSELTAFPINQQIRAVSKHMDQGASWSQSISKNTSGAKCFTKTNHGSHILQTPATFWTQLTSADRCLMPVLSWLLGGHTCHWATDK